MKIAIAHGLHKENAEMKTPPTGKSEYVHPEIMARELAERIADDLFRNGSGKIAQRLELKLPDPNDPSGHSELNGGGWCRASVVSRVADLVRPHLAIKKQRKAIEVGADLAMNDPTPRSHEAERVIRDLVELVEVYRSVSEDYLAGARRPTKKQLNVISRLKHLV